MVLSDGGKVNGSELVNGINEHIQNKVPVTGDWQAMALPFILPSWG
jgi:hypothetical protein